MKAAVFVALLALASAAPRPDSSVESAELIHDEGVQGTYVFTAPNGETVELRLVANENGAVFESPSGHLPVAPLPVQAIHPIPEHALEAIEFAAQQRAAGVEWDQQGFVIED